MSDDIPSLAEALAEIRRLRADNERLLGRSSHQSDRAAADEIRWLRARIAELEAIHAVTLGTLEKPQDDEPLVFVHHVPPNAPPHDE